MEWAMEGVGAMGRQTPKERMEVRERKRRWRRRREAEDTRLPRRNKFANQNVTINCGVQQTLNVSCKEKCIGDKCNEN
jgi:hypothetical protein